jgi:hypothetical protein
VNESNSWSLKPARDILANISDDEELANYKT